MSPPSAIGFRIDRGARRIRRALFRHIYVNRDARPGASVLVAGSARSGTTWIGDLLAEASGARTVFEPFHSRVVREFREFGQFPYRRPDDEDPALYAFCEHMLSGRLRGAWVDRGVEHFGRRRRVVKVVRANLFLGWLIRSFPEVPVVLVVRHPCAVIGSRMALGWSAGPDFDAILARSRLVEDLLGPYREIIERARSEEERNAVVWSVHHLVPLHQKPSDGYLTAFYETMCTDPDAELSRILRAVGSQANAVAASTILRPSTTSRLESAAVIGANRLDSWRRKLDPGQIDTILGVVRAFGLGSIYDDSPLPLADPFSGREPVRA